MSYSFHLFDLNGAVAISRRLALKDDLDALDEAVRQSHAHAVEMPGSNDWSPG